MIYFMLHHGCLLRRALWPLDGIHNDGFVRYSPAGISVTFINQEGTLMAVLQLRSSDFQIFACDGEAIAAVKVGDLRKTLSQVRVEESLTMEADYEDSVAQFSIRRHRTYAERDVSLPLYYVEGDGELLDQSGEVYHLVVGITARKFRFILTHLVTPSDRVSIFITDNLVKFSATNGDIVLEREHSECIIGGTVNKPVQLNFATEHSDKLWTASLLSSIVWILESEKRLILFNFPSEALGNIMFYFLNNP